LGQIASYLYSLIWPIQQAALLLGEAAKPAQVVLFGSYARGDAREDSDVDVLVYSHAEIAIHQSARLGDTAVCGPDSCRANTHHYRPRHDEKLYEALLSREEMVAAQDLGNYCRVPPDLRDLNYGKFVEQGEQKISQAEDYNSHNTARLDVAGMKRLLMKLRFMQAIARGEQAVAEE